MSKRWGILGLSALAAVACVLIIGCGNGGGGAVGLSVPSGISEDAGTLSEGGFVSVPEISGFDQVVTLDYSSAPAGGEGKVKIPGAVTIPAGSNYAYFDIEAVDNSVSDGDYTITITASCGSYTPGVDTMIVVDDE